MRVPALMLAGLLAAPVAAQETPRPAPGAPITEPGPQVLTVDLDRIIAETAYGVAMAADLRARDAALQAEFDASSAEMRAAELDLAARRSGMTPEAFRAEADAFDERAEATRAAQDAKFQSLATAVQTEQAAFLDAALPILRQIVTDRGGSALLEGGAVIFALPGADITDEAIARIDDALGTGPYAATP